MIILPDRLYFDQKEWCNYKSKKLSFGTWADTANSVFFRRMNIYMLKILISTRKSHKFIVNRYKKIITNTA